VGTSRATRRGSAQWVRHLTALRSVLRAPVHMVRSPISVTVRCINGSPPHLSPALYSEPRNAGLVNPSMGCLVRQQLGPMAMICRNGVEAQAFLPARRPTGHSKGLTGYIRRLAARVMPIRPFCGGRRELAAENQAFSTRALVLHCAVPCIPLSQTVITAHRIVAMSRALVPSLTNSSPWPPDAIAAAKRSPAPLGMSILFATW
jgi:hypothetical protein